MKPYTAVATSVLALVSLTHFVRMAYGWEILVAGVVIPVWLSGVAGVAAAGLAYMVWRESHPGATRPA